MYLNMSPYWFKDEGIKKIEESYGAKYMGYWCTRHTAGWWNESPVDVFYQPNPDVAAGHTHYFGMFVREGKVYITNAISAFSEPLMGVLSEDGEVLVSRYRNDCIVKGDVMVDGGRDYMKRSGSAKMVQVRVVNHEFIFEEIENRDLNTIR